MNTRSVTRESGDAGAPRLLPWIFVALAVALGVILAFRYGLNVTPLIDGIR